MRKILLIPAPQFKDSHFPILTVSKKNHEPWK